MRKIFTKILVITSLLLLITPGLIYAYEQFVYNEYDSPIIAISIYTFAIILVVLIWFISYKYFLIGIARLLISIGFLSLPIIILIVFSRENNYYDVIELVLISLNIWFSFSVLSVWTCIWIRWIYGGFVQVDK